MGTLLCKIKSNLFVLFCLLEVEVLQCTDMGVAGSHLFHFGWILLTFSLFL